MQKTNIKRLAASGQINGTKSLVLVGVLLSATATASCIITADADGSGDTVATFRVIANTAKYFDLSAVGGIALSQGYATLVGAGIESNLFFE